MGAYVVARLSLPLFQANPAPHLCRAKRLKVKTNHVPPVPFLVRVIPPGWEWFNFAVFRLVQELPIDLDKYGLAWLAPAESEVGEELKR